MKARDVEDRLQQQLPLLTDRFTDQIDLVSVTPAGTTATAVTSSAHGLSVAQKVLIAGTDAPVSIASIDRVGTQATAVTVEDHDLTSNYIDQPNVTLSGSNEAEFNGTFRLLDVPNRKTFIFEVADSGPASATGSPLLDSPGLPFGYNGLVDVTAVLTDTSFQYDLPQVLTQPARGDNMRVIRGVRIHAAITEERATQVFETKDVNNLEEGQLALFVILGAMQANRDRNSLNDGVSSAGVSGDNRQQTLQALSCIVFQKVTQDVSGADALDDMQDIARYIIGVLAGWAPSTGWARESGNKLRFVNHDILFYNSAVYAHMVEFQLLGDISNEDLEIVPENVAFRDISFAIRTDVGDQILSATVDLDDVPLEG